MQPRIAVAAIFKNELPYVLEWVAYYRCLGVDRIIIGDNVSDDGTSELLEALDLAGIIDRLHAPRIGDTAPQAPCYRKIIEKYRDEMDLILFVDADEFLVATNTDNPIDQLRRLYSSTPDLGAVAINWRVFGSSGQHFQAPGLVLERFYRCSEPGHEKNCHIKTAVNPRKAGRMNIHECELSKGRYYTPSGRVARFSNGASFSPFTHDVDDSSMVINHYVIKSWQENMTRKCNKGSAAGSAKRQKGEAYFRSHDLNSCQWHAPQALLKTVKQQMEDITTQLGRNTPYYHYGYGAANIDGDHVSGWAVSDYTGPIQVKILIDGSHERITHVQLPRPDVVRHGLSKQLECGFRTTLPSRHSPEKETIARIYGSSVFLNISQNR
ncbi:hypothetical protein CKO35_04015 [Ectothiorhodospira shaposhnikovii]|uniref:glycosyltransferase family 2 protein n=1 Tax=Ectothiorhodospira shaposhnikovii TaxID=1054 RepID=UPI001908CC3B|nr:glycosyltransferase family 2 protein [Ectothiorhodospira shaposhnikovii]MBK1672474.1 hypothetical protein [Ectothiorhodospira shaposhnikovii]